MEFNEIPDELLQGDSKVRQMTIMVNKKGIAGQPHFEYYVPLHLPMTALTISDIGSPEIEPLPVAVYELDREKSRDRPFYFYFYKGDAKRP